MFSHETKINGHAFQLLNVMVWQYASQPYIAYPVFIYLNNLDIFLVMHAGYEGSNIAKINTCI